MFEQNTMPSGRERVDSALFQATKSIEAINKLKKDKPGESKEKRITALNEKITKKKKKLVFLSLRARDPITRYFASNALKKIADIQKSGRD